MNSKNCWRTSKRKDITLISFGSLDGWNAIHEWSAVQHLLVSLDYINNFVYGVNNATFDTPENQQAAAIMQDWVEKGYFSEGFPVWDTMTATSSLRRAKAP